MSKKIVLALVPGVLTSLLASLLMDSWSSFSTTYRTVASLVIGVLTVLCLIFIIGQKDERDRRSRVASNLVSKDDTRIEEVDVAGLPTGDLDVASDIRSSKGVHISNVKVRTGKETDAAD